MTATGRPPRGERLWDTGSGRGEGLASEADDAALDARVELPAGARAPRVARAHVREWLSGRVRESALTDVLLLVSELITNGVRHGEVDHRPAVALRLSGDRLRVEVWNRGAEFAPEATGPRRDGGGWGLYLVEAMTSRWGVDHGSGSTRVWFELDGAPARAAHRPRAR